MKRRTLIATVGIALTMVLCASTEQVDPPGLFGISGIIPDVSLFEELRLDCATSGFWIGPGAGFLGSNKEALHTRQFRGFVERGITPIATLYLGDVGEEHATWTEEIVRHYTSGQGAEAAGAPILYWELGDEQNGAWGTSCDPEEYARRVSLLAPAIRRACPQCSVVMGGLLDGPDMGAWRLEPYFRRFLAAGGGDWIDVYAFHYYGLARPNPRWPAAQLYDSASTIVEQMGEALHEYGVRSAPIWVTETSTFSGLVGEVEQSESEQAADLVKRYVLLWSLGVDVVQWCYLTEPQYEGTGVGFFDQSGLVYDGIGPYDRGEGVKKRAYVAYQRMLERLRGAILVDRVTGNGATLARFEAEEGPLAVLWQDPWVREGPLWIEPADAVSVEGLCGEALGVHDRTFRLDLTLEPVYLIGDVAGVSVAAPALHAP